MSVTHFVAKLYAYGTMNRTIIHDIILSTSSLYNFCLEYIKLKYGKIDELCNILQVIKKAFENFKTEHLTFQYFQKIGCLILPSTKEIHSSLTFGLFDRFTRSTICHRKITIVPLKIVLKNFLEIPVAYTHVCLKGKAIKEKDKIIARKSRVYKGEPERVETIRFSHICLAYPAFP